MPIERHSVRVSHSVRDMFDLVAGVRAYPDFIPWIKAMRVSRERATDGERCFRGEALVGFRGFTERFATDVIAREAAQTIDVNLVRGPFRKLKNRWWFREVDGGTEIDFEIDYEFSNIVLRLLASSNMDYAIKRLMSAFLDEADRRYSTGVV